MTFIDPSSKNEFFNNNSIYDYITDYRKKIDHALSTIPQSSLDQALVLLKETKKSCNQIWVLGNGGSASIAEHLCCDFSKGTRVRGGKGFKTHSLTSNTALLTAIANDFGYEHIFSHQLEMFASKNDLVLLISSSGNSPNVVQAAQWACENNLKTISFTGFTGGKLSQITEVNLHINVNNYGVVEDSHQILMHCFAQYVVVSG